jgi:hypothetical protein
VIPGLIVLKSEKRSNKDIPKVFYLDVKDGIKYFSMSLIL